MMCLMAAAAAWVLFGGQEKQPDMSAASEAALRRPAGYPQLVGYELMPAMGGQMCQWAPASARTTLVAALRQERLAARAATGSPADASAAAVG